MSSRINPKNLHIIFFFFFIHESPPIIVKITFSSSSLSGHPGQPGQYPNTFLLHIFTKMLPQKQQRLKHLTKLRVKSTSPKQSGGPCSVALINLLSCWASNSQGSPSCAHLEEELKLCMATRVSKFSLLGFH